MKTETKPKPRLTNKALATRIARAVFEFASWKNAPVTRIQFVSVVGKQERVIGGLCEKSLRYVIHRAIDAETKGGAR